MTAATKKNFLDAIGSRIEKLIDSIPILGVPTPIQPWDPLTDTKAAILSDPFDVLKTLLKWDGFHFATLLEENSLYLSNMRHVADARRGPQHQQRRDDLSMKEEDEPVMSDEESPIFATSDDASVERSVASFADLNTDDGSYEECPSVVTECVAEKKEVLKEIKDITDIQVNILQAEDSDDDMMTDDENEYVLADEPESEEEDFVDVSAEA